MKRDLTEKTIHTEVIHKGRIIQLQLEDVLLPNGQSGKREVVKHPGAVAIIAFTEDNQLLMVRQYRKALEKEIIEIPAGKLEANEDPLACAQRELAEETGYQAERMELLTSFYTSPGFADEIIYLYVARELKPVSAKLDEDEFVELIRVDLDQAKELIEAQKIHDAKTMYAVQYWELMQTKR